LASLTNDRRHAWNASSEPRRRLLNCSASGDTVLNSPEWGFPEIAYPTVLGGFHSGRLFRHGMASISAELAGIFEQLGCSAQTWQARLEKLKGDRLLGRFFATTRAKLREISERLGGRYVVNLTGCPTR
jgi:hypothetical protein